MVIVTHWFSSPNIADRQTDLYKLVLYHNALVSRRYNVKVTTDSSMRRHGEHLWKNCHKVRSGIEEIKKISFLIDNLIFIKATVSFHQD